MKRIVIACMLILLLAACNGPQQKPITRTQFDLLDTVVIVTLYDAADEGILDDAFQLCADLEKVFSRTDPDSEVYRLNAAAGQPVSVSDELLEVLSAAVEYARLSGGRYDVTICPVVDLWDFTVEPPSLPDEEAIAAALERVGWENIVIEGNTVRLENGAMIDLGSIAKGYIADRMGQLLRDRGVGSAIIDLGGNILTVGGRPDGTPFRIGVQDPDQARGAVETTVPVTDRSVVTSGTYERSFTLDGVLYHHILDVATGYPARTGVSGITVIADRSMDADALSTTLFLLGPEEGIALAETLGVEVLFLTENGGEAATPGFLELMNTR